jgi:hypothetical protein
MRYNIHIKLSLFLFLFSTVLVAQDWNQILFEFETGNASKYPTEYTVAISGVYGFVSTKKNAVVVCKYDGNTWQPIQTIRAKTPKKSKFGKSISVWNDVLVVGAPSEKVGAVYMYRLVNGAWKNFQIITVNQPNTHFGYSLSINNNLLAIGAPATYDTTAKSYMQGAIYLYTPSDSDDKWHLQTTVLPSDSRQVGFGCGVAVVNDFVLVRSQVLENPEKCTQPEYFLFVKNGKQYWTNVSSLTAQN